MYIWYYANVFGLHTKPADRFFTLSDYCWMIPGTVDPNED